MGELVVSLTEVQKLKERLGNLNNEYLELYQKMEDLNKEKEFLESIYMAQLGALVFINFEKEIEYRKLKKKLSLIIQYKNKKEDVNMSKIEELLKIELREFYKNLEYIRESMKNSRIYLDLPTLTEEELKKVKEIFRSLAKKLHPDINKNLDEESIELWNKVKEAYENNDLLTLIVLEGIINNIEIRDDIKVSDIETNIKVIEDNIKKIKKLIEDSENEFPLNLRNIINDESFINNKKRELTLSIKEYEGRILELKKLIREALGED